jgi:tetratricopeptide (TPR) repeat protein
MTGNKTKTITMKFTQPITSLLRLFSIIACLIAASAFAGHPTMGVAQQHLHEAADALNKAKTSTQPIVELQKAINSLDEALHNKKGHRAAAVPIIERAIAEFKQGNRNAAYKTVDEALAEIDKAVAAGHKNLKKK